MVNPGPLPAAAVALPDPAGRPVILHVRTVTGSGGGPDKTILLSSAHPQAAGYQVATAYMHPPGDAGFEVLQRRARDLRCRVLSIPDRGPLDPLVLVRLLQTCRRLNVRIWHAHEYKSNAIGLLLRPLHSMKLVTTLHGWVQQTRRTRLYYAVDRFCLRHYDHAIAISADLYAELESLRLRADRRSLLPNGVDQDVFQRRCRPALATLRRQLGVPNGRAVLGAVGRLSPEKGFDNLIRALPSLLERGLDVELWIAGEGESRRELHRLIDHLGVEKRVKLLGFREDVTAVYEAVDLVVISSSREGLPNVLLEAMAMSTPVVATAVAGIPAVVRDGVNGLLCPPGDVPSLAAAIARLLQDGPLRERLAEAGRRTVEARFTFADRLVAEQKIYARLLS